jgi:hypothetical protein
MKKHKLCISRVELNFNLWLFCIYTIYPFSLNDNRKQAVKEFLFLHKKTLEYFFNKDKKKYACTPLNRNVYFNSGDCQLIHCEVFTSYGDSRIGIGNIFKHTVNRKKKVRDISLFVFIFYPINHLFLFFFQE